jgi:alcohol dehydrogenase (cytochrome c)
MKHIRLILGIIAVATATIAAMAQAPPSPTQPAPQAQTPTAPVPNGRAAPGGGQGRGGGQQAPVPGAPPVAAIDSPLLRNYSAVTKQRLLKPEDRNWLMIRRTYDGWGYSPLDKITPANVSRLKLVWSAPTQEPGSHQAPPLVNNGVMFISTPNNQVAAYDAKTGTLLWRYKRTRPQGAFVAHPSNRGLALYGDKVFYGAGEAVVVALDAKTGKEVWAKEVFNNKVNYYITLAPLAADGKILVGASGGEFGVRGYVAALDPDTGNELWRTYTVPAPGEPGSETWPKDGEQWKTGGGSVWVTGNYDPETNIAYWGTGNGGPWMGDQRPGDNLYTASTIALNASTGKLLGHFQYNPNESFDWDEVSPPLLIDFRRNGRTIRGLVDASRSGYLWFLERTPQGPIRFVDAKPFVNQTAFKSLDPKTGKPTYNEANKPGTGKEATYCPNLSGGKNWPPAAFNPKTRMFYIPANNNLCSTLVGVPVTYTAGRGFTGTGRTSGPGTTLWPGADHVGEVQAWNVDTGEKVWTHNYRQANWGPILTTGGDLVFAGGTPDQMFHAFDAKTGKLLWEFKTSSGVEGPPSSFEIDGKQYIAVLTGWGADAGGAANTVANVLNEPRPTVQLEGAVYVFAVE